MFPRLVRIQLALFAVASLLGISAMVINYLQAPAMLGIGRMTVTMELPDAGGLYRFANVTYRGVQIGKVTEVDVHRGGAVATLSLDTETPVPRDLRAEVRSVSAVGEQYVDLLPRSERGPFLEDGSVIPASEVIVPQPVGPMMDQLSALVTSIPKNKLGKLLDESFLAFNGAGPDLQSLTDSASKISADADATTDQAVTLIEDSRPVLDGQLDSADALRTWTARLAGVSGQLVSDDPHIRTILKAGPVSAQEVSRLMEQVKPTLPVLLANMTSLGQVAVTYHPGLEQLLVLLPPAAAMYQSATPANNPTGIPLGDFRISVDDPPACTVGFLPPSQWRNPADTSTIDTPDGLYCKLPQDSAISVRGARNFPCMDRPGKYAPTVEQCRSDSPFQPLAARQHATGPYPFDPNLVGQGVPLDDRVTEGEHDFAPIEGTPPPAAAPPAPPVAAAHYDPTTGQVATPGAPVFTQSNLAADGTLHTWQDMVLPPAVTGPR